MPKADGLDYQARFWSKVNKRGPWALVRGRRSRCWIWTAGKNSRGYGYFFVGPNRRSPGRQVHVLVWEWAYGRIAKGLERDHLCRRPACVRLSHLEAVTPRVNQIRGRGFPGVNDRKERCPRGHAYSGTNFKGSRICRICNRAASRRHYWKDIKKSRDYFRDLARRKRGQI